MSQSASDLPGEVTYSDGTGACPPDLPVAGREGSPVPGSPQWWDAAVYPLPHIFRVADQRKSAVAILLSTFLLLKVIVIARGDLPTALGILQTASLIPTILGALLSGLPLLALAALVYLVLNAIVSQSPDGWLIAVLALAVCFFLTPWRTLAVAVALAFTVGIGGSRIRRHTGEHRIHLRQAWRHGKLLFIVPSLLLATVFGATAWTLMYDVWLPHEKLTLQSGKVDVGYVLSDDGTWVTLLRSGERQIHRHLAAQVTARTICTAPSRGLLGLGTTSVWGKIAPATTPVCPAHFIGRP